MAPWAILIGIAVCFEVVRRFVIRRLDRQPVLDEEVVRRSITDADLASMLNRYGVNGRPYSVPQVHLPLDHELLEVLESYESVVVGGIPDILTRDFLRAPFGNNMQFVQVGVLPDGSPVVVRRRSSDAAMYVEDVDSCLPGEVKLIAHSVREYLADTVSTYSHE